MRGTLSPIQAKAPDDAVADAQAPIGDLLVRVSAELAHLGQMLDDLEAVVGRLIIEAGRRDPDVMHHAQGFDHIGQKISGLADFLAALAPSAPRHWLIDPGLAARALTLADLASRLGAPGAWSRPNEKLDSTTSNRGDCELF
ncbi:hypothetical protein [Methylocapsa acidiphila]|uniref:hypothetical protein n=1 Tax=Methylocapsa acidiphila TaxID=133552 RepID=UPI000426E561|nr:hypothetical protein [Methylocapsa acidiphila]